LTKKRDFTTLALRGRSIFGPYATLRIVEAKKGQPGRVAFITSTKMFKLAVDRNRTKRRLREAVRGLTAELPANINLLFVAKPEARDVEYMKLVEEIRRLISKIPEALTMPARPSSRGVKHQKKMGAPKGVRSSWIILNSPQTTNY
jgi:ribonuclease P protein component